MHNTVLWLEEIILTSIRWRFTYLPILTKMFHAVNAQYVDRHDTHLIFNLQHIVFRSHLMFCILTERCRELVCHYKLPHIIEIEIHWTSQYLANAQLSSVAGCVLPKCCSPWLLRVVSIAFLLAWTSFSLTRQPSCFLFCTPLWINTVILGKSQKISNSMGKVTESMMFYPYFDGSVVFMGSTLHDGG